MQRRVGFAEKDRSKGGIMGRDLGIESACFKTNGQSRLEGE